MAPTPTPASSPSPVEPGYQTTEFWMALATSVIGLLMTFKVVNLNDGAVQQILGLLALVVPQALYIVSRGIRKQGQ